VVGRRILGDLIALLIFAAAVFAAGFAVLSATPPGLADRQAWRGAAAVRAVAEPTNPAHRRAALRPSAAAPLGKAILLLWVSTREPVKGGDERGVRAVSRRNSSPRPEPAPPTRGHAQVHNLVTAPTQVKARDRSPAKLSRHRWIAALSIAQECGNVG